MIRDPSDGSVREGEKIGPGGATGATRGKDLSQQTAPQSGLPLASTKPKDLAKLEKSREWLKAYHGPQPEGGEG